MHSYLVSLRISGKGLSPSDITKHLAIEPTQVRIAGDFRPGGKTTWHESMWEHEAKPSMGAKEWKSLEEGLQAILGTFSYSVGKLRDYQRRY